METFGMRLTKNGKLALAKALTGKELKFLYIEIGDGEFDYDTESVFDLTELRSPRMQLPITECVVVGNGDCDIKAFLSNADLTDGFAAREHGVYAREPDTGVPILFAYRNAGEDYDFIPSNATPVVKALYWQYTVEIQDAENITAVLDLSVAYINTEEFKSHINATHPHPNAPSHYADVTEVDCIWGTDHDNHLHKLSLNNLKALVREDAAETSGTEAERILSDEEIIFRAKAELGLDANMLVVEDFKSPDTVDNFRVRVTSSAENGTLLGVADIDGLKTGAEYVISDGIFQETVKIISVVYNISGYHARLDKRLDYAYDFNNTYLYRTTNAGADKANLTWITGKIFQGVEANIARTIELETRLDKAADFDITGDGYLTADGFFTLAG